jgi:hypothetical protein
MREADLQTPLERKERELARRNAQQYAIACPNPAMARDCQNVSGR